MTQASRATPAIRLLQNRNPPQSTLTHVSLRKELVGWGVFMPDCEFENVL